MLLVLAGVWLSPLVIAQWLHPDPRGYGTHEQLGLPPCGFKLVTGLNCPGCGGTTAFVLAAHGHVWKALRCHIVGTTLAVLAATLTVYDLFGALTNARLCVRRYLVPALVTLTATLVHIMLWSWQVGLHLTAVK